MRRGENFLLVIWGVDNFLVVGALRWSVGDGFFGAFGKIGNFAESAERIYLLF